HRWLGAGSDTPQPARCIVVEERIVGWVDFDVDREWLEPGEVNVGYNVFAVHRGKGYASRAVQLLMHHLAVSGEAHTATLLVDPGNEPSLAVASRCRFVPSGEINGSCYFRRPVPPLEYSDGVVTIRRQRPNDLEADLAAKDDEQIDWLWLPGERDAWETMTSDERRAHALRCLLESGSRFEAGPKWAFSVDSPDGAYVAYVDCDLANDQVPSGEANVSYSAHPAHRGKGYVVRAVRLIVQFLSDHTGARQVHLLIDEENLKSLRVAQAVGAVATHRWVNDRGDTMVRHVLSLVGP
ncbi:MAG TPA: GNAT family N-acetyltransferase, partial [Acidimicrobiales bacterium]|nr:GNAT family N-acetyltransferase [Acidimicrobiales bacterium]